MENDNFKMFIASKLSLFLMIFCFNVSGILNAQTSYTLQKALQTAKANNPILKTEQYNIDIAASDIVSAQLRPNLKLNNQTLQLTQPSLFPANTDWSNKHNRQVWWQLTKAFQFPNQRKFKIEIANQNTILQEKVFSETERNLFQDVALKWLDVWTMNKRLDVFNIAKSNIDSLLKINRLRYQKQVITQIDLSRTELLSNEYALQIRSLERSFQNEYGSLAFLMGVNEEFKIDLNDEFVFTLPPTVDSLMQEALNKRSDLVAAKANINVANSNIKLQKSLAISAPEAGMIYNPQNSVPYFGIFITQELPFFSRNQGEIKKSHIIKHQAEQALATTQRQVQTEIAIAFNAYKIQKANLEDFKLLLDQANHILNSVKYSYLQGGTTIIDLLEAQRSWLNVQELYNDTQLQYRQSYIKLMYATGFINKIAQ